MKNLFYALYVSMMLCPIAHSTTKIDAQRTIEPWGRETVENTKAFFSRYKHIFLVRITRDHWEAKNPPQHSSHHYEGKVAKVYKGNRQISEKVSLVTYLDGQAPLKPADQKDSRLIVLTNDGADSEIALDTGELLPFRNELEPALEYFYPAKR